MTNPIRKLPVAALIYATGDVLVKATNLLLLPVLTRFLSPGDFGIVAGITAFSAVLGIGLQLNLGSAITRFYPECASDQDRRSLIGTVALFTAAWAVLIVLVLNVAGGAWLDNIFKDVRFDPFIRIGTWLALIASLNALPLVVLQMQQRPVLYRTLSLAGFLANVAFLLLFVVALRMGALGAVLAQAAGAAVTAIPSLLFLYRRMDFVIHWRTLKACLLFSMPLVLYAGSGWIMDSSNRFFIERYASLEQLGLFNVGTQFAMILGLILGGVGLAYTPLFYETIRLKNGPEMLARFGLFYISCALGLGLLVAVFSRDAIRIFTQPEFHEAYRVVPILTATQAMTAFWHLVVNPLMFRQRTGVLAGIVAIATAIGFALNLWLVPAYGIIGAALAPLIANAAMNAMVFAVSIRLYRVPYNYAQMTLVILSAAVLYTATVYVPVTDPLLSAGAKLLILALYPVMLFRMGVLDRASIGGIWRWNTNELLER